jgi:hypothetical protein
MDHLKISVHCNYNFAGSVIKACDHRSGLPEVFGTLFRAGWARPFQSFDAHPGSIRRAVVDQNDFIIELEPGCIP